MRPALVDGVGRSPVRDQGPVQIRPAGEGGGGRKLDHVLALSWSVPGHGRGQQPALSPSVGVAGGRKAPWIGHPGIDKPTDEVLGVGYLKAALSEVGVAFGVASLRVRHVGPPGGVYVSGRIQRAAGPLKAARRVNECGIPLCQEPGG